ncbi:MAG: response regulator [Alphaproteobacteria bacterium]|nr:response regulator [Alphaproteobacteria bacterium]
MLHSYKKHMIVVADEVAQTRNLISEVLRGAGFENIRHVRDGQHLLDVTEENLPRVIITTSRLPGLSGLEFTRLIRGGYKHVNRHTSIIAMTNTPTKAFLDAARESGVDEMLVRPFTAQAVLLRVQAVLDRPREFIDSAVYVGPCRRRRMVEDYIGPMRRFVDPVDDMPGAPPWESEPNRAVVRICVQKISESVKSLTPGDRKKLREVYGAVKETETLADQTRDAMLAAAARSLGRYITAIGAAGTLDPETVSTHIDAMHTLGLLTSSQHVERQKLVDGLGRIVDKKLGRMRAA